MSELREQAFPALLLSKLSMETTGAVAQFANVDQGSSHVSNQPAPPLKPNLAALKTVP